MPDEVVGALVRGVDARGRPRRGEPGSGGGPAGREKLGRDALGLVEEAGCDSEPSLACSCRGELAWSEEVAQPEEALHGDTWRCAPRSDDSLRFEPLSRDHVSGCREKPTSYLVEPPDV